MRQTDEQLQYAYAQLDLLGPVDVAWLAGLFEGDGSFTVLNQKKYRKVPNRGMIHYLHYSHNPIVILTMTDQDIITRAAALLSSSVRGPYPQRSHISVNKDRDTYKPLFSMSLSGSKALKFCDLVYALMGQRRQAQIDRMRQTETEKFTLVEPLVPEYAAKLAKL